MSSKLPIHPKTSYSDDNNDNNSQTSCDFYVKSIQVKHSGDSGREHRERMRYCGLGRKGDNKLAREYGLGFISRTVILVLADSHKST
jgi:hypothetical protein